MSKMMAALVAVAALGALDLTDVHSDVQSEVARYNFTAGGRQKSASPRSTSPRRRRDCSPQGLTDSIWR